MARSRAVEIDDVQRTRTIGHPPARRVEGIGVVDGLRAELPLVERGGLDFDDVDGRVEDHAACRAAATLHMATKFSSIRSPSDEDFSGWNCTPNTRPWLTI